MLIACPTCAANNNLPDSPDPIKVYRCGKCKSKLFNSGNNETTATQNTATTATESQPVENLQTPSDDSIDTETKSTSVAINEMQNDSDDSSLIDLCLSSDDVALIVNCIDWVLADIESANYDYSKLDTRIHDMLGSKLPNDAFSRLVPMLKSAEKNVLMHSIGHFEAMHDSTGRSLLQNKLTELDKATTEIQRFKELVSIGTSVSTMSHRKQ